jgi:DNA anti-recombination protein RmuC
VAKVDLEFLARQIERVINDVAGLKDDMMVVLARLDRIDATTHSLVTEVRAMPTRHDRLGRRLDRVEEREHQGS